MDTTFLLLGIGIGAFLGLRFGGGLFVNGGGGTTEQETCLYFCNGTETSSTCDAGPDSTGKCLKALEKACKNPQPNV